jgi:hypothetical protein
MPPLTDFAPLWVIFREETYQYVMYKTISICDVQNNINMRCTKQYQYVMYKTISICDVQNNINI